MSRVQNVLVVGLALVMASQGALAQNAALRNPYRPPVVQIAPPSAGGVPNVSAALPTGPSYTVSADELARQLTLVALSGPSALVRQRTASGQVVLHHLEDGAHWRIQGEEFKVSIAFGAFPEITLHGKEDEAFLILRPGALRPGVGAPAGVE